MRGKRYAPQPMRIETIEEPALRSHDVRIEVQACNVVPNLHNILANAAPHPAAERYPARDGRLIARQRATGDPARGGELNADIEQRDRCRPGGAREDERASSQYWPAAYRDNGDTNAHDDHAQTDRTFVSQTSAKRRNIERSYHCTHAKRAQHDAVGLSAAMQEVARDDWHQCRD